MSVTSKSVGTIRAAGLLKVIWIVFQLRRCEALSRSCGMRASCEQCEPWGSPELDSGLQETSCRMQSLTVKRSGSKVGKLDTRAESAMNVERSSSTKPMVNAPQAFADTSMIKV